MSRTISNRSFRPIALLGLSFLLGHAPGALHGAWGAPAKAIRQVAPAVVLVQAVRRTCEEGRARLEPFSGSGLIFTRDGFVLTNHHVIHEAVRISCILVDGREVDAERVGSDPTTDIAVIRLRPVRPETFPVVRFGRADRLRPGDPVIVVGNPRRFSHTASLGVISHPKRYFQRSIDSPRADYGSLYLWLQTDAVIEPGSSGSPLVDMDGRVVGMATRHFGEDLGLAIPSHVLQEMAPRLIRHGSGRLAEFGLMFQSMSAVGLPDVPGMMIAHVSPGSSADKAGLKPGDLLVSFQGKPVQARLDEEIPDTLRRIVFTEVGTVARVGVLRNGQPLEVSLDACAADAAEGRSLACEGWGFTVQELSPKQQRVFDRPRAGLRVGSMASGSPASLAGLQVNDVLDWVDDVDVSTIDALERAYADRVSQRAGNVLLRVSRGRACLFVPLVNLSDKVRPEVPHEL